MWKSLSAAVLTGTAICGCQSSSQYYSGRPYSPAPPAGAYSQANTYHYPTQATWGTSVATASTSSTPHTRESQTVAPASASTPAIEQASNVQMISATPGAPAQPCVTVMLPPMKLLVPVSNLNQPATTAQGYVTEASAVSMSKSSAPSNMPVLDSIALPTVPRTANSSSYSGASIAAASLRSNPGYDGTADLYTNSSGPTAGPTPSRMPMLQYSEGLQPSANPLAASAAPMQPPTQISSGPQSYSISSAAGITTMRDDSLQATRGSMAPPPPSWPRSSSDDRVLIESQAVPPPPPPIHRMPGLYSNVPQNGNSYPQ